MSRPRPATAAARSPPPNKSSAAHNNDANASFDSSLVASKAFPMTREVYTTNMNIGLPTVKQKNMSESLVRLLERPRSGSATSKLKRDSLPVAQNSVSFGSSRPGTATPGRHTPAPASASNLVTPLFSAYGVSEKKATPSFAPTQFLQRPISASRPILRPPSASSVASAKRPPSAAGARPSEHSASISQSRASSVEVYAETKHPDHHGVGAAKLVELTQKLVMRRMENLIGDVDAVQWQTSDDTFKVDLPLPAPGSSASGAACANLQPWMRLHDDTDEIIIKLEWSGAAPAVTDNVRNALIQSLGVPAAIAKLHSLSSVDVPNMADLDLSVIMLDDKLTVMDVIYYNNLCSRDCSLLHSGDNAQTGLSSESTVITLSKVSPSVHAIAFSVNLHGVVPPHIQQQRAVSSEGRPGSSKFEHHAEAQADLNALAASDILWVPEQCTMRVFSSVHSFLLASYNIAFVASDDVWNSKLTRRPMSGGGRLRTMSKSSSMDHLADSDADVEMVADSDGDAAWDEIDKKNGDGVIEQGGRRAGRFLGNSLRNSINETRLASAKGSTLSHSEEDPSFQKLQDSAISNKDLVQYVAAAAHEVETTSIQYIDWICFVDSCDATGNLHIQREVCLEAFRTAAASFADASSSEPDVSTHPIPLSQFPSMLKSLLPLVREAENKIPQSSTLRRGMEAMCASLGYDSRQPLSEQIIDIARVQRGANVLCLHRGNQSSAFAASIAAKNARSAGKMEFINRTWFLQTLGTLNLAVNLVQNLPPLRELLVMSGVFIPIIVAVEYCTAPRPSVSLRGNSSDFSDRFDALKIRVERSLPFVKVEANPSWMLPGGPRISAFEVFLQDPFNMNCVCIHSKSESKSWPKPSEIVLKLQRLIRAREKIYKLPVDLCLVRLKCLATFNHVTPLPSVPVHIYRIGDENEISSIASDSGAPSGKIHSLCVWQGDGVRNFVTSDASALCISGRSASDGVFTTRLSAGVYCATIGGDDMVREHALLFVRTLQKSAVTADILLKPRLYRLSGRVVNGSSGNPISHGAVTITSSREDGDTVVVELGRAVPSDSTRSSSPVPQLPITRVPQPDTFSDYSGPETGCTGSASGRDASIDIQDECSQMNFDASSAKASASNTGQPSQSKISFSNDVETISSTIFAVVNDTVDDSIRIVESGSPHAMSEKISKMTGTFEVMLPQGEYKLSVNVQGYSAGGIFQVNMRRGGLHMGVISVHPDSDLLLLNSLRDMRSKQRFNMQGILSANMSVVSAVLSQASTAELTAAATAAEALSTKKRILRAKFARSSESNPASFVSSYQLSVPLVLLRGIGVVADKSGKISIRHRSHRFSSLSLPPSACRPGSDAVAISELAACKSKAAHIARHVLCGVSYDFIEKLCTIDSRALSDDKDVHKASFMLIVHTTDSPSDDGGTFLKVGCGGRLAAIAGIPVSFTLHFNDRCMSPCSNTNNIAVQCSVRLERPACSSDIHVNVFEAANIGPGLFVVSFTPPKEFPGVYTVSCTVNRIHVEGSPFSVTVMPHEPAVTSCSRLTLQPAQPCLPWPHCCSAEEENEDVPTLVVSRDSPALVVKGWYAPFELYNEETARWVGNSSTVGDVDVVLLVEICLENQPLVDALRHCSDTLVSGLLQLDLCTSLSVGLILYTHSPPSTDTFEPVQVHGPCFGHDAVTMMQSALSSESFVGRALELEGNRNLISSTPTNVDAALAALCSYQWRPLSARAALILPRNAPSGLEIHHMQDHSHNPDILRWWQSCEKLRSMSVELHAIRLFTPFAFGPASSFTFSQCGYPFSVTSRGKSSDNMSKSALTAIDEVEQVIHPIAPVIYLVPCQARGISPIHQAIKTWHVVCNNPKLSSAISDSTRRLALTAHAAYSSAVDACFTVQTQQTGGIFLMVTDVPCALAALPQLIAQSLDMRLFTEALITEAVVNREHLLLIPNVADRKRLLLKTLQRNNVTLRRLFFMRDSQGKAALRPSLVTMDALVLNPETVQTQSHHSHAHIVMGICQSGVIIQQELALSHLKGEYRTLLLDQSPMLNVRLAKIFDQENLFITLQQKLALAHRRGSAFALAIELVELGLL